MRIVEIDEKNHIGIFCDDEYYRIIEAVNGYLACHDDEFQNDYMSVGSSHEIVINNNIKVVIRRNSARSCYVGCWLYGEEVIAQTFGFNKGKEYAHGSNNIEISLSKTLKYGKYGVFIRAKKERAAMVKGQIEYLRTAFIQTLYHGYLETIEEPVKFEHTPTLVTELKLSKPVEDRVGYVEGSSKKVPKKIADIFEKFYLYNSYEEMELIYRLHDAGIKIDEPRYDSRDERDCYDYIDEEDERVGRHGDHTFDYNKDIKTRDEIIYGAYEPDKYKGGGTRYFNEMTPETLRKLIDMKFADPDDIQNHAPSINAFMNFISTHEGYTVGGYTVDITRDDYRIAIDFIKHDKCLKGDNQIIFVGFIDCVKQWYRDPQNETWHSPASQDDENGYAWWD